MNELEKENTMLKQTNIEQYEQIQKLQEENEELRNQLQKKEEEEQLYAKEILRLNQLLNETNEFKDILGGY